MIQCPSPGESTLELYSAHKDPSTQVVLAANLFVQNLSSSPIDSDIDGGRQHRKPNETGN